MATGKPSFATPRTLDLRGIQSAVDNIRERFTNLEAMLDALTKQVNGSTSATDIKRLQQQLGAVSNSVGSATDSTTAALIAALLDGADGIVVLSAGVLTTRHLVPGANISITNPDGVNGNPIISASTGALGGATYPLRRVMTAAPQFNPQHPVPRIFHRP